MSTYPDSNPSSEPSAAAPSGPTTPPADDDDRVELSSREHGARADHEERRSEDWAGQLGDAVRCYPLCSLSAAFIGGMLFSRLLR